MTRAAISLAQAAAERLSAADRSAHVGYYLIDHGRPMLERAVGCRFSWKLRASMASRNVRLVLYLGPILLLTALATSLVLYHFTGFESGNWRYWLFASTGIIGSSALAISLVNLLVTRLMPPRALPRLDFSQGIPDIHRTMVIVPTLLSRAQEVDDLLEALEIRYLGNRDPNLFFALLTDFGDAPERALPGDGALLAHARAAVQALNETYSEDRACIFYLFHRPRVWNPVERVWMGYERKRGKLEQFNALLRGGAQAAFSDMLGDLSILPSIKYVITLDTDTQLPRDAARTLAGNLAHPLNVYDAGKGRIVEGYAILQPRASISLTSAGQSRFTKLFAGDSGVDPYTREVSDVYQDCLAEGSFIGKGIYDVDAFRSAVDARFPRIYSQSRLARRRVCASALVTDVILSRNIRRVTPGASRRHRWIAVIGSSPGGCCRGCQGLSSPTGQSRSGKRTPSLPCRCGRFSTISGAASCHLHCLSCWQGGGFLVRGRCGSGAWWSWL